MMQPERSKINQTLYAVRLLHLVEYDYACCKRFDRSCLAVQFTIQVKGLV